MFKSQSLSFVSSSPVTYGTSSQTWGPPEQEVGRAESTHSSMHSLIHDQRKASHTSVKAQPVENSPEVVRQEAKSVSHYIKKFFKFIIGFFFPCCVGKSDPENTEPSSRKPLASTSPSSQMVGVKGPKKKGPIFPSQSSDVSIFSFLRGHEVTFFEGKEVALAEYDSYGRLIAETKGKIYEKNELIDKIEQMSFYDRLKKGLPSSKDLKKEDEVLKQDLRKYEEKMRNLERDLNTRYIQHPQFGEVLTSHEGFPFKMMFEGEELKQGLSYASMPSLPRNDYTFQRVIGQRLKSWSGEKDIDPVGLNITAQAQLVLVSLTKYKEPFVMQPEDRRHRPETVDGTVIVRFEREEGKPVMVVEREVRTNQNKRFSWVETVHFDGQEPRATRDVKEIKQQ